MAMIPEMKRYTRRIMAASAAYVGTLTGVIWWFRHFPPAGALAYAVAVLPALPIIGMFVSMARLLVELRDEYVRVLLVRQSLVATGFAMSAATIWGFLEGFRLVPHVESWWVAMAWCGGLGIGGCVNWLVERQRS